MLKGWKLAFVFVFLISIILVGFSFSFNKIYISVDGKKLEHLTSADNVEQVIGELEDNISLKDSDLIQPELDTKISDGLTIKIIRVKKEEISLQEEIPFKTEYKNDSSILSGQKRIIEKGQNGILTKKYLVTYHDGSEKRRDFIEEEISREPISEVIVVGTKKTVQRAGKTLDYKKILTMRATAYTHTGNRTYTGVVPKRGTVAVDPKIIPLGSKLYIDGYGFAVAEDIGGSIKGQRIDLFMETKNEALKWGSRSVRVYILN